MTARNSRNANLRGELYRRATLDAFIKLNPRLMARNPVMFAPGR
jgi:high-affinity K+ transport system ATPase subunit B